MITFVVPGYESTTRDATSVTPATAQRVPGRIRASVHVERTRDSGASVRLDVTPGTEAVLVHLEGGLSLLLHPEHARDLLLAQAPLDSTALSDVVEVPIVVGWDGVESPATRGGLLDAIKRVAITDFEIVTDLLEGAAADLTADALAALLDDQVKPGVYQLLPDRLKRLKGEPPVAAISESNQPVLVFVHGTFVDTSCSFGKLWEKHPAKVSELFEAYPGRVYALEHRTLTESPIQNALLLAAAAETGTAFHLVTHSRGGLVAEVLARVCGNPTDHASDAELAFSETERAALTELRRIVQQRQLTVARIVRVACPARGTLLASKRLDALISIVKWALTLAGVPVAPEIVDFLGAVAAKRLDPELLPGLAAMMPGSPLVQWLNSGGKAIPGQLRVVAGDVEGTSLGGWVKSLVSDLYYWTDNDLVVHTRSMYGGAPREKGASFFLHAHGDVSHFNYFSNEVTARAIVDGIVQEQAASFDEIGPLSFAGDDASGTRGASSVPAKPAVFIIPGIVGSNLDRDGERLWLSFHLAGRIGELAYASGDGISAGPPIDFFYGRLSRDLEATHEVIPFGFDWRKPLEAEAERLAAAVRSALELRVHSGTPVRLLAHSMGGLLVRTMELRHPEVWTDMMQHHGARVLMLGVPQQGSYAPMQVLTGDHTFGNWLTLLGAPLRQAEARRIIANMPGLLQLQAGLLDATRPLGQLETWTALAAEDLAAIERRSLWHRIAFELKCYDWGIPEEAILTTAVKLRRELDARALPFPEKVKLVVGRHLLTPRGFEMGPNGLAYLNAAEGGDGQVTLGSALLPGVDAFLSSSEHSLMPTRTQDFDAYRELLVRGTTDKLERVSGATRSADVGFSTALPLRSRPSREPSSGRAPSHIASLLSGSRPSGPSATAQSNRAPSVHVVVEHGSLKFVRAPLLVGHYLSDSLTGAEYLVDRFIGGTMSTALEMRSYPGQPGDRQIFVNKQKNQDNPLAMPRPESVIVVGLGDEGSLRAKELSKTVRHGVLSWAQQLFEAGRLQPFELASVLVGSGGAEVSAGASARAIVQGVLDANDDLLACKWPTVATLTLVEVYQERAAEAWRELQVEESASRGRFLLARSVRAGTGGYRRPLDQGYRGADYDLITATTRGEEASSGNIYYTLDTRRARTEVRAQATQVSLVRAMVKRSAIYASKDVGLDTGRTLFRLLVPQELRPFLATDSGLVLQLDDKTAAIPWELLRPDDLDDDAGSAVPWAIRTKLLRKFETAGFSSQISDARPQDGFLVIGNPKPPERYRPLPGAVTEATKVAKRLEQRFPERVKALVTDADAVEVVNAVFAHRYRVVHIAAHGELGADKGVVLSDDIFLSAKEFGSMQTVPELVFINCCYLAAPAPQPTVAPPGFDAAQFAASIAAALITKGVRCVVAAGWAVGDAAAAAFADAFYDSLLRRRRFQDAVADARSAARAFPDNTWAAYQCYGDPEWQLVQAQAGSERKWRFPSPADLKFPTPLSVKLYLETLVIAVNFNDAPQADALQCIAELDGRFDDWTKQGDVAEAFGNAYAAAGATAHAITWYRRALAAADGASSVHASEQLANLIARQAADALRATKPRPGDERIDAALAGIDEALGILDKLIALAPTSERLSLRGSAFKRRALIYRLAAREGEREAIEDMRRAYREAEDLARERGDELFYPGQNRLAAELLLAADRPPPFSLPKLSLVLEDAALHAKKEPDFWSVVAVTELQTYEAYAAGTLPDRIDTLLKDYEDLQRRVPGTAAWASVRDTASFVFGHPAVRARFSAAIDRLLSQLAAYASGPS